MGDLIYTYNRCAKGVETTFNKLGAMPFGIPIISSQVRALANLVVIAVAKPLMLVGGIGYLASSLMGSRFKELNFFREMFLFGAENLVHGTLNIFRSMIEFTVSAVTLPILGVGSLALIPFNMAQPEPFAPIFSYGSFVSRRAYHISLPGHTHISVSY